MPCRFIFLGPQRIEGIRASQTVGGGGFEIPRAEFAYQPLMRRETSSTLELESPTPRVRSFIDTTPAQAVLPACA